MLKINKKMYPNICLLDIKLKIFVLIKIIKMCENFILFSMLQIYYNLKSNN